MGRAIDKLSQELSTISSGEQALIKVTAALVTILSTALVVLQYLATKRLLDQAASDSFGLMSISYTDFFLRLRITCAHAFNLIGMWHFKARSFLLSCLALTWVAIEYGLWFMWSFRVKATSGLRLLPHDEFFGLYRGNIGDAITLTFSVLLMAWVVKILSTTAVMKK